MPLSGPVNEFETTIIVLTCPYNITEYLNVTIENEDIVPIVCYIKLVGRRAALLLKEMLYRVFDNLRLLGSVVLYSHISPCTAAAGAARRAPAPSGLRSA